MFAKRELIGSEKVIYMRCINLAVEVKPNFLSGISNIKRRDSVICAAEAVVTAVLIHGIVT